MSAHQEPKPLTAIDAIRKRHRERQSGYDYDKEAIGYQGIACGPQYHQDVGALLMELDQARSENELLAAKVAVLGGVLERFRDFRQPEVCKDEFAYDRLQQNYSESAQRYLKDLPTAAASLLERVKRLEADRDALIDAAGNPERYALRMIAERDAAIARAEKAEAALSAKSVVTREAIAAVLDADILCFPPKRNLSAANWERQRTATFAKADAVLALFQPDQMGTKD